MFGLTFEKLLIIGVIAVFLLGPERLPQYAAGLGRLVRSLRDMATGAKERMREEMGPEFDDVDWRKLDPRQYDPRRIVRDALNDVDPFAAQQPTSGSTVSGAVPPAAATAAMSSAAASSAAAVRASGGTAAIAEKPPFDPEAT